MVYATWYTLALLTDELHAVRLPTAVPFDVVRVVSPSRQMWVAASGATQDLFATTIQPILDSYKPPGFSALGFRKVSLGTIPPKVTTPCL